MASVQMRLDGIGTLREALMHIPYELQSVASKLAETAARNTAARLLAAYPGSGPLKAGVHVVDKSSALQAKWRVESRSKEADWWEFGTQNRHTQEGWNRGSTPAHPDTGLISIAIDERRTLHAALVAFVEAQGFVVTEEF